MRKTFECFVVCDSNGPAVDSEFRLLAFEDAQFASDSAATCATEDATDTYTVRRYTLSPLPVEAGAGGEIERTPPRDAFEALSDAVGAPMRRYTPLRRGRGGV